MTVKELYWAEKTVRTGGISGPLHSEWTLRLRLSTPAPVRAALYLKQVVGRRWELFFDKHLLRLARRDLHLDLALRPWDWENSVAFSIDGLGLPIEEPLLHVDLRGALQLETDPGGQFRTARPVPLLSHADSGTVLGMLAVASSDTAEDRMRWRLKADRARIAGHDYLNRGRAAGRYQLEE